MDKGIQSFQFIFTGQQYFDLFINAETLSTSLSDRPTALPFNPTFFQYTIDERIASYGFFLT